MKVGGFGELENLRRSAQREDTRASRQSPTPAEPQGQGAKTDEVQVSGEARVMGKLSQVPDVRRQKVEAIKQEVAEGRHVTRERLHNGIRKLLQDL